DAIESETFYGIHITFAGIQFTFDVHDAASFGPAEYIDAHSAKFTKFDGHTAATGSAQFRDRSRRRTGTGSSPHHATSIGRHPACFCRCPTGPGPGSSAASNPAKYTGKWPGSATVQ